MEIIVIIRPSFKKMCGDDACRAALFNHLLYWIAQKAKGQPADKIKSGEVYWYGSVDEEICTGMANSWSAWKIRKELDALTKGSGALVGRRHNPAKGWDREYQYFIGEKQGTAIKEACKQHDVDLSQLALQADVTHLLKTVKAFEENSKSISGKPEIDSVKTADPSPENRRAIPKVPTKVSTKERQREASVPGATPTTPTPSSLSFSEKKSSQQEPTLPAHLLKQKKAKVAQ